MEINAFECINGEILDDTPMTTIDLNECTILKDGVEYSLYSSGYIKDGKMYAQKNNGSIKCNDDSFILR